MPERDVPPTVLERAARIARGPHSCPSCEAATWTEPPVPWTDLRDYMALCDACGRPIDVRISRAAITSLRARPQGPRRRTAADPVDDLLTWPGAGGTAARAVAALPAPLAVAALGMALGAGAMLTFALVAVVIVPAALWGPAIAVRAIARALGIIQLLRPRRAARSAAVEVCVGRWCAWTKEQHRRERDRVDHPDAVLAELGRILGDRELRRVRSLAERGDVPAAHLDDLLRYRRAWRAVA